MKYFNKDDAIGCMHFLLEIVRCKTVENKHNALFYIAREDFLATAFWSSTLLAC